MSRPSVPPVVDPIPSPLPDLQDAGTEVIAPNTPIHPGIVHPAPTPPVPNPITVTGPKPADVPTMESGKPFEYTPEKIK